VTNGMRGRVDEPEKAAAFLAQEPSHEQWQNGPVIPAIYMIADVPLSMLSMIAQFGTPEHLVLADPKIEAFFPADK
jgi:hypothetical protein